MAHETQKAFQNREDSIDFW